MKKVNRSIFSSYILTILVLCLFQAHSLFAQTTIYSEDFTGQNGKGIWGGGSDFSGVTWTVDASAATLSNSSDYCKVNYEILEACDTDGECIWSSPSVDISTYTNVSISIALSESGYLESSDYVDAEYKIDAGSWTNLTNGYQSDDFSSATATASGLSGSSLQIRIKMTKKGKLKLKACQIIPIRKLNLRRILVRKPSSESCS